MQRKPLLIRDLVVLTASVALLLAMMRFHAIFAISAALLPIGLLLASVLRILGFKRLLYYTVTLAIVSIIIIAYHSALRDLLPHVIFAFAGAGVLLAVSWIVSQRPG